MNWYDVAHFVLTMVGVLLLAVIFIEYIEDQREKYRAYTLTTETHIPTTTWVLETKFKELTNKDISDALEQVGIDGGNLSDGNIPIEMMRDFAHTVVRKAQEK